MVNLIWQPSIIHNPRSPSPYDFSITLDLKFAKKMIANKISEERKSNMQRIGLETISPMEFRESEPFRFFEDTALVEAFHLSGNGIWLSSAGQSRYIPSMKENLVYHSHNTDTAKDAFALMSLVTKYVEYSEILIK